MNHVNLPSLMCIDLIRALHDLSPLSTFWAVFHNNPLTNDLILSEISWKRCNTAGRLVAVVNASEFPALKAVVRFITRAGDDGGSANKVQKKEWYGF